jgi:hypothetical protein
MKTSSLVGGGIGLFLLTAVFASQLSSNSKLHDSNAVLLAQLQSNKDLTVETETVASMSLLLEEKDERIAELEASLEQAKSDAKASVSANAVPKALQVKTYLGDVPIGSGIVYSENVRRDPKTGLISFNPVLKLPESLKRHFVVYHTNIVEREVSRPSPIAVAPTYVNNYPSPYYYPSYSRGIIQTTPARSSTTVRPQLPSRTPSSPKRVKPLFGWGR